MTAARVSRQRMHPGKNTSLLRRHLTIRKGYPLQGPRSKAKNLGVLKPAYHASETAACLIEVSFMSDPADEHKLKELEYRTRIGTAVANGVVDYLRTAGKLPEGALVAGAERNPEFEDATALA